MEIIKQNTTKTSVERPVPEVAGDARTRGSEPKGTKWKETIVQQAYTLYKIGV
jgi:hypothetical protein